MECTSIEAYLETESFEDLCFQPGKASFVFKCNEWELGPVFFFDPIAAKQWVLNRLSQQSESFDAKFPIVDFLYRDQFRIHAVFSPLTDAPLSVSIRKHMKDSQNPWINDPHFQTLSQKLQQGKSLFISGATGSGKTTFLRGLIESLPAFKRIICIEDTPELYAQHQHLVSLRSRKKNPDGFGEIGLSLLMKEALRMRPDHLVLGECRGAEVFTLLQAINTGHGGCMGSIHANSCRESLKRIELLSLIEMQGSIRPQTIRQMIASGLHYLVHLNRSHGTHQVQEIQKVEGLEGDTLLTRPLLE